MHEGRDPPQEYAPPRGAQLSPGAQPTNETVEQEPEPSAVHPTELASHTPALPQNAPSPAVTMHVARRAVHGPTAPGSQRPPTQSPGVSNMQLGPSVGQLGALAGER